MISTELQCPNGKLCCKAPAGSYCPGIDWYKNEEDTDAGKATVGLKCAAGKFTDDSGKTSCSECLAGTYQNEAGKTSCKKCAGGKTSASGASTSQDCTSCPKGSFAGPGSSVCIPCPSGFYQHLTEKSVCYGCQRGKVSGVGQSDCAPSSASPNAIPDSCQGIPNAGINANTGDSSCQCAAHYHLVFDDTETATGYQTCQKCNSGFDGIGLLTCNYCSIGQQRKESACQDCTAGKHTLIAGTDTCNDCPAGTFKSTAGTAPCTICPKGFQCPGGTLKEQCIEGKYSYTGSSSCEQCPSGTISNQKESEYCTECVAGKYADASQTTCTNCAKGKFSSSVRADSQSTCTDCPRGKFSDILGSKSISDCKLCADGEISQTSSGIFVSEEGQTSCTKCPAGKFAKIYPSQSYFDCEDCPRGKFTANAGQTACQDCPFATYSFSGTSEISGIGAATCKQCPEGKYLKLTVDPATCELCQTGKFANDLGFTVCTDCGVGKVAEGSGLTICRDCEAGKQPNDHHNLCVDCSKGKYSNADTLFVCEDCNFNTFANNDGLDQCESCSTDQQLRAEKGGNVCFACGSGASDISASDGESCTCKTHYESVSGNQSMTKRTSSPDVHNGFYHVTFSEHGQVAYLDRLSSGMQKNASDPDIRFYKHDIIRVRIAIDSIAQDPRGWMLSVDSTADYLLQDQWNYDALLRTFLEVTIEEDPIQIYLYQYSILMKQINIEVQTDIESFTSIPTCFPKRCSDGQYWDSSGIDPLCRPCEDGSWSDNGHFCVACEQRGTVTRHNAKNSSKDCVCDAGWHAVESTSTCNQCEPGTFKNQSGNDIQCTECPHEMYSSKAGAVECLRCPQGMSVDAMRTSCVVTSTSARYNVNTLQFQSYTGNRTCSLDLVETCCEKNEIWNQTLQECSLCAIETLDRFRNDENKCENCKVCTKGRQLANCGQHGQDGECMPCSQGKFKNTTDVSENGLCVKCPLGKTTEFVGSQEYSNCHCDVGTEPSGGGCAPCPQNHFKATISDDSCTECGDERISPAGSTSESDCERCPLGWGKLDDSEVCEQCPAGTKSELGRCVDCTGRTYQDKPGQTTCHLCPSEYCVAGEYGSPANCGGASSGCSACPANSFSSQPDNQFISDCLCDTGHYRNLDKCIPCSHGSYKNVSGNSETCLQCPANMNTSEYGAVDVSQCLCEKNFRRSNTLSGAPCVPCVSENGEYAAELNSSTCSSVLLEATSTSIMMDVGLGVSMEEFDENQQQTFLASVAATAGVDVDSVEIQNITTLSDGTIQVEVSVTPPTEPVLVQGAVSLPMHIDSFDSNAEESFVASLAAAAGVAPADIEVTDVIDDGSGGVEIMYTVKVLDDATAQSVQERAVSTSLGNTLADSGFDAVSPPVVEISEMDRNTSVQGVVATFDIEMSISLSEFDESTREAFKHSVAIASQTDLDGVRIHGVSVDPCATLVAMGAKSWYLSPSTQPDFFDTATAISLGASTSFSFASNRGLTLLFKTKKLGNWYDLFNLKIVGVMKILITPQLSSMRNQLVIEDANDKMCAIGFFDRIWDVLEIAISYNASSNEVRAYGHNIRIAAQQGVLVGTSFPFSMSTNCPEGFLLPDVDLADYAPSDVHHEIVANDKNLEADMYGIVLFDKPLTTLQVSSLLSSFNDTAHSTYAQGPGPNADRTENEALAAFQEVVDNQFPCIEYGLHVGNFDSDTGKILVNYSLDAADMSTAMTMAENMKSGALQQRLAFRGITAKDPQLTGNASGPIRQTETVMLVKTEVSLQVELSSFNEEAQVAFREAVAQAIGVTSDSIIITGTEDDGEGNTVVTYEIVADTPAQADAISKNMAASSVGQELQDRGMPLPLSNSAEKKESAVEKGMSALDGDSLQESLMDTTKLMFNISVVVSGDELTPELQVNITSAVAVVAEVLYSQVFLTVYERMQGLRRLLSTSSTFAVGVEIRSLVTGNEDEIIEYFETEKTRPPFKVRGLEFKAFDAVSTRIEPMFGNVDILSNATPQTLSRLGCDAGQEHSIDAGELKCRDCPVAEFSPDGLGCQSCSPEKTTIFGGAVAQSECVCRRGFARHGVHSCVYCEQGKSSHTANASQCTQCDIGKFADKVGSSTCSDCPGGKYSDQPNSALCLPCDHGTWSKTGASTCVQCTSCAAGNFSQGCAATDSSRGTCSACPQGKFSEIENSASCAACPVGQYQDLTGQTFCKMCGPGLFADKVGSQQCKACSEGKMSFQAGASSCELCPRGTYQNKRGQELCRECDIGKIAGVAGLPLCADCAPGKVASSLGSFACQSCTAGKFQSAAGQSACSSCLTGSFSSQAAATHCTACAAGTFSGLNESTSCEKCGEGQNSVAGATECTQCTECGYDQENVGCGEGGGAGLCQNCAEGFLNYQLAQPFCSACAPGKYAYVFNPFAAISVQYKKCADCATGKFSSAGQTSCVDCNSACAPGEFPENCGENGSSGTCSACLAGKYLDPENWVTCTACPSGKYQPLSNSTQCLDCGDGKIAPEIGSISCISCPVGKHRASPVECSDCDAGKFTAVPGQQECAVCDKGTFSGQRGSSFCTECLPGSYADVRGMSSCRSCPGGKFNAKTNMKSDTSCLGCVPGKYSRPRAAECLDCAAGSFSEFANSSECILCQEGFESLDDRTACVACSAGKYSALVDGQLLGCLDCDPGKFNDESNSTSCLDCPQGKLAVHPFTSCSQCQECLEPGHYPYWCGHQGIGESAQGICEPCPAGFFLKYESDVLCTECAPGQYSEEGSTSCLSCPAGKFQDSSGQPECKVCPAGSSQSLAGQVMCNPCVAGQSQPFSGQRQCDECQHGKISDADGAAECEWCPAGKYAHASRTQCQDCQEGKYKEISRQADCESCDHCGDMQRALDCGGMHPGVCTRCAGCTDEKEIRFECDGQCVCKPTFTRSNDGVCTSCSAGKSKSAAGDQECSPCTTGTFSNAGAFECSPCQRGSFADFEGAAVCAPCPQNTTTEFEGANSRQLCICDLGFHHISQTQTVWMVEPWPEIGHRGMSCNEVCDLNSLQCDLEATRSYISKDGLDTILTSLGMEDAKHLSDQSLTTTSHCIPMPYESESRLAFGADEPSRFWDHWNIFDYQEIVVNSTLANYTVVIKPIAARSPSDHPCANTEDRCEIYWPASGQFNQAYRQLCACKAGVGHSIACVACEPGTYNDKLHHHTCSLCDAGKYLDMYAANSSEHCEVCPANFYSLAGSDECEACPFNGTSPAGSGSVRNCTCPAGAEGDGLGNCWCAAGFMRTGKNIPLCMVCAVGQFCTGQNHNASCECVPGFYCPAGSTSSMGTECPVGYFCTGQTADKQVCTLLGHHCPSGSPAELPCGEGTYSDEPGKASCKACQANSVSVVAATNISDCKCNTGYTGPDGGSCSPCGQGKYKDVTGSGLCSSCDANANSPVASPSSSSCLCNKGYTGPDGGSCSACEAGKYKISDGSAECVSCVAGKYSTALAADFSETCQNCAANANSPEASPSSSSCTCNAGYTGPDGGSCSACGQGKFKTSTGSGSCTSCDANANSPEASTGSLSCLCNAGYTGPDGGSCSACGQGKYKSLVGSASCQSCVAGKFSASTAATDATACTSCEEGKYSATVGATSESSCVSCQNGQSSPAGSDEQSDCFDCPAGSYSRAGSTSTLVCTQCPGGTYAVSTKTVYCSACKRGTYSSWGTSTLCTFCPQGKSTGGQYGSSVSQCVDCTAGKYSARSPLNHDPRSQYCLSCPAGKSSPAGSDASSDCTNCPVAKYSSSGSTCSNCPHGKTSPAGSDASSDCTDCAAGKYSPGAGQACTNCPAGKASGSTGQTQASACVTCENGKYADASNSACLDCTSGQVSCPAGQTGLCRNGLAEACHACEAGSYKPSAGTQACTSCTYTSGGSTYYSCPSEQQSSCATGNTCGGSSLGYCTYDWHHTLKVGDVLRYQNSNNYFYIISFANKCDPNQAGCVRVPTYDWSNGAGGGHYFIQRFTPVLIDSNYLCNTFNSAGTPVCGGNCNQYPF